MVRMTRTLAIPAVAVCAAAIVAGPAWAATWQYVGTSGFTTPATFMRDSNRIRFNSIALDSAGNVYVTAVNSYNYGSWVNDYFVPDVGGLTIFKTDGSKIDVNLAPVPGPRGVGGVGGVPGGITKLVQAGDGKVYALQNWYEINYPAYPLPYDAPCVPGSPSTIPNAIPDRILRVNPDGTVTIIYEYSPVTVNSCSSGQHANRITGMDVGDDGNIYWTMNPADGYWKYHFFWRYDVTNGTIEDSPHENQHGVTGRVNDGMAEMHRMFDLVYVGRYDGPPSVGWFTVLGRGNAGSPAAYYADAMSWTEARGPQAVNANAGLADPGWGRDWVTATAYDAQRRKLWMGGRGSSGTSPWSVYSGSAALSGTPAVIDLGGGNAGLRVGNAAGKYYTWRRTDLAGMGTAATLAARFQVESLQTNYVGTLMYCRPIKNSPVPGLMIRDGRYKLYNLFETGNEVLLADIAPVVLGQWEEIYIYSNQDGTVKAWWNGSLVANLTGVATEGSNGEVAFGASVYRPYNITPMQSVIVYDWVACDNSEVAPPGGWRTQPIGEGGLLACYLDGGVLPTNFLQTCIMSRWDGDPFIESGALYDSPFYPGQTGIGTNISWHANGNAPDGSNMTNYGLYWVSALAVHPKTGAAWMSWGANPTYNFSGAYGPIGAVYTMGPDSGGPDGNEGSPQAAHPDAGKAANLSQVVALASGLKWMYALTYDIVTGEYNLFRTPTGTCNEPPQDTDNDGDVDLQDFSAFQACFNGPNRPWPAAVPAAVCSCLDLDSDGDVDLTDFGAFQACFNGPNRPPACPL